MMKFRLMSWAALCAIALAGGAAAADDSDAVAKIVQQLMPGSKPDHIVESPVPGLYEVGFGPEVLYVTKAGRYALQGDLINLANKETLTEARRSEGRLQLITTLNAKDMIVFPATAGKVKHTVTVFTAVDCGYSRKLQSQKTAYNKAGITVRFLAFPRSGADTPSYYKAAGVWCAKDRRAALNSAMRGDAEDFKKCDNPVQAQLAVAERNGES